MERERQRREDEQDMLDRERERQRREKEEERKDKLEKERMQPTSPSASHPPRSALRAPLKVPEHTHSRPTTPSSLLRPTPAAWGPEAGIISPRPAEDAPISPIPEPDSPGLLAAAPTPSAAPTASPCAADWLSAPLGVSEGPAAVDMWLVHGASSAAANAARAAALATAVLAAEHTRFEVRLAVEGHGDVVLYPPVVCPQHTVRVLAAVAGQMLHLPPGKLEFYGREDVMVPPDAVLSDPGLRGVTFTVRAASDATPPTATTVALALMFLAAARASEANAGGGVPLHALVTQLRAAKWVFNPVLDSPSRAEAMMLKGMASHDFTPDGHRQFADFAAEVFAYAGRILRRGAAPSASTAAALGGDRARAADDQWEEIGAGRRVWVAVPPKKHIWCRNMLGTVASEFAAGEPFCHTTGGPPVPFVLVELTQPSGEPIVIPIRLASLRASEKSGGRAALPVTKTPSSSSQKLSVPATPSVGPRVPKSPSASPGLLRVAQQQRQAVSPVRSPRLASTAVNAIRAAARLRAGAARSPVATGRVQHSPGGVPGPGVKSFAKPLPKPGPPPSLEQQKKPHGGQFPSQPPAATTHPLTSGHPDPTVSPSAPTKHPTEVAGPPAPPPPSAGAGAPRPVVT
eukprot:Hpha_TRINITY_DN15843_c7_g6::TRINITY_DN15843_c7_g6_i2::g.187648::m.187648